MSTEAKAPAAATKETAAAIELAEKVITQAASIDIPARGKIEGDARIKMDAASWACQKASKDLKEYRKAIPNGHDDRKHLKPILSALGAARNELSKALIRGMGPQSAWQAREGGGRFAYFA
jgi:hypothetical protein